jgi:hypothetical protein
VSDHKFTFQRKIATAGFFSVHIVYLPPHAIRLEYYFIIMGDIYFDRKYVFGDEVIQVKPCIFVSVL